MPRSSDHPNVDLIARAASAGLPFALWRRPGASESSAIVSTSLVQTRPIFAAGQSQPFFAMGRFESREANQADAIAADVLYRDGRLWFYDGNSYQAEPVDQAQRDLMATEPAARVQAPAHPGLAAPTAMERPDYEALVARTVEAIRQKICAKIVLSRVESRPLPETYDLLDSAQALMKAYPNAFIALVSSPTTGTWLVATPETLLAADRHQVQTMALAGTLWPAPGTDPQSVEWPDKIVEEQGLVAQFIREAFVASRLQGVIETAPRTVQAANLVHLRSDFSAPLEADRAETRHSLAELLNRLHPTSAVCGMPKTEARDFIGANEGYDRTYYTGYLGPVGLNDRTDLYVNLRSAQVLGRHLHIYVGGGIVAQSEPATEWEETVQKSRTIGQVVAPLDSPASR